MSDFTNIWYNYAHPLWNKDDCLIVCHIGVLQSTCKTSGTASKLYLFKKVPQEKQCTVCHCVESNKQLNLSTNAELYVLSLTQVFSFL